MIYDNRADGHWRKTTGTMRNIFLSERGGGPTSLLDVAAILFIVLVGAIQAALPTLGSLSAWALTAYVLYESLYTTKLPKNRIIMGLTLVAAVGMSASWRRLDLPLPLGEFMIHFLGFGR